MYAKALGQTHLNCVHEKHENCMATRIRKEKKMILNPRKYKPVRANSNPNHLADFMLRPSLYKVGFLLKMASYVFALESVHELETLTKIRGFFSIPVIYMLVPTTTFRKKLPFLPLFSPKKCILCALTIIVDTNVARNI